MPAKVITNFIAKLLFKQKGAIANNKAVEFSSKALEERLKKFNVDPNAIKSEGELNQVLSSIKQAEDQAFTDRFGSMLQGSRFGKQGEVVDMTGKKLNPNKNIMGGTQTTDDLKETIRENLMKTDNPFSELVRATEKGPKSPADRILDIDKSLRGKKVPTTFSEDIERQYGLTLQGDETIQEVIDMISDINKNKKDFATGGRAGFRGGLSKGFLEFLKKFNVKQSGDDIKNFLSKRQFLKDMFGNTEKNKKARELAMLKEAIEKARKEGGYKFKDIDVDKDIRPIFDQSKDRTLNSDGGRAGFANGSEDSGAPSIVLNPEEREMEKVFETNKVEDAIKEIIKRAIPTTMAEIPISEKGRLRFGFDGLNDKQISGGLDLLGGELNFGAGEGRQGKGIGFEFKKRFADGGRIGYKDGPDVPGRRKFMKIMGGIATIPILGKYIKPAMPLIKKGAEITGPALDKIIETVMSAGKLISQSGKRLKELTTKKKLGKVEVEEDIADGSYIIKKDGKEIYYKKGRMDETGVIDDDIIEVVEDTVTKKAGGGIARMLGE
jgi:hypothetical protein